MAVGWQVGIDYILGLIAGIFCKVIGCIIQIAARINPVGIQAIVATVIATGHILIVTGSNQQATQVAMPVAVIRSLKPFMVLY